MTTETDRRIGSEFVSMQPSEYEILTAFVLQSTKLEDPINFPADEEKLAQGLQSAAENAPFLRRFLEEGKLTVSAQDNIRKLHLEGILIRDDNVYRLTSDKTILDHLTSQVRMVFKEQGVTALREAILSAEKSWSEDGA